MKREPRRNYGRANWEKFREVLESDWKELCIKTEPLEKSYTQLEKVY